MRLFISYARVDKPYCVQIAETLDIHQVWYDQRLYAGQQWWKEIQRRLDWCEGFVYLLSPESVASEYCRREFQIARKAGKHIFPVLIHEQTEILDELKHIQYADLSNGLTTEAVKTLLNAIYISEIQNHDPTDVAPEPPADPMEETEAPSLPDFATVVRSAAEAMETGKFDEAVFLLKQAQENGHHSRFIDLSVLLHEAEIALEKQTYLREAEREYKPISELVKRGATRRLGCQAFQAFRKDFPDYDPDNLARFCMPDELEDMRFPAPTSEFSLPLLEWCEVPEGLLYFPKGNNGKAQQEPTYVEHFHISKYPVTNAQYQMFVDAPDGYANVSWWDFSPEASKWRQENPEAKPPRFKGDNRPRETVTWYEAVAFCNWLSHKTQLSIMLPTCEQWQRAARGDDERLFPWGNDFDIELANTRESKIKMTTLVVRYDKSFSPFGVYDMAGNVWEWCLNAGPKDSREQEGEDVRAIFGGSFISDCKRAQTTFHFNLNPEYHYATIGFRLVSTFF